MVIAMPRISKLRIVSAIFLAEEKYLPLFMTNQKIAGRPSKCAFRVEVSKINVRQ